MNKDDRNSSSPSESALFGDLAQTMLRKCFACQNSDGGLPETFPNTKSGCWTSSEIYAAVSIHGLEPLCPIGAMDSLENYLSIVCKNHDGRGLPYYQVEDAKGEIVSERIVDSSAAFVMGLSVRRPNSPHLSSMREWLVAVQSKSGGWGIFANEPERVYSTAYAVMALEESGHEGACERGKAFLESLVLERDGRVAWPYRPEVSVASPMMTEVASTAVGIGPGDGRAAGIMEYLVAELEKPSVAEEEEFHTRSGLKLMFAYSPRLVSLSRTLSLIEGQETGRRSRTAPFAENPDRLLALLARHEYRLRGALRPVPELFDERLWHYVEFAWGYGAIETQMKRLGKDLRRRYDEHVDVMSRELTKERVARIAPPPVSETVRSLWEESTLPGDKIASLVSLTEIAVRLARARMLSLVCLDAAWKPKAYKQLSNPSAGCGKIFWGAWGIFKKADSSALPREVESVGKRLRTEIAEMKSGIEEWIQMRNRLVHEMPKSPGERRSAAERFESLVLEAFRHWDSLLDPPLVTLEEIGLPGERSLYRYRTRTWRGAGFSPSSCVLDSYLRLPDRMDMNAVGENGASVPQEVRAVYMGYPELGTRGLIPMFPFVVRMLSLRSSENRFFFCDGIQLEEEGCKQDDPAAVRRFHMSCPGEPESRILLEYAKQENGHF